MTQLNPRISSTALAIAAALATLAGGASADPVVVFADTSATVNGLAATPVATSNPGYAGSSSSQSGAAGRSDSYAFARDNGAYAVRTNAEGMATATSFASFKQTLTNSSGSAKSYSMSFHIYGGYLSTYLRGDAVLEGLEFLSAQYLATIKVNGSDVFSSEASVRRDASGASGLKFGEDLNPFDDASDGDYSWGGGYYTVNLGTLAAGESIDVLASLSDQSQSNVGTYTYDGGCCAYGYDCDALPTRGESTAATISECTVNGFKGASDAFYGDPINFLDSSFADAPPDGRQFVITAAEVPEPGMFGLAFLALGAAGWASRRRKI